MPIYTLSCFIQLSTRVLNVPIPPFITNWYSREVFPIKGSYVLPGQSSYTNYYMDLSVGGFYVRLPLKTQKQKQTTEFTGLILRSLNCSEWMKSALCKQKCSYPCSLGQVSTPLKYARQETVNYRARKGAEYKSKPE